MTGAAPRLAELAVASPLAVWERLGFAVADGTTRVGATTIRLDVPAPAGSRRVPGFAGWTLAGEGDGDVDGLPTGWLAPAPAAAAPDAPRHPNGALLVDHVVVTTPDLERTLAALAAIGLDLRRTRDAGTPERPLRQAFFRIGEVILEVVGPSTPAGNEAARFWGLVVVVSDLDACAALLGADLGEPRDAVQPGRRIATVRRESGAGVPLAFMTPDPRHRRDRAAG